MRLADKLSLTRGLLAPVFFVVYFIPVWTGLFAAASVFVMIPLLVFAELTDYFDGYFARKRGETSDFGKLFDPFCDVILNMTVLFCAAASGYMPYFFLLLIIYREFIVSFVRLIAAKKGVAIGARRGGKIKTVVYIVTCFYALTLESCKRLGFGLPSGTEKAVIPLAAVCAALAYVSLADYLISFKESVFPSKTS
ncbi:MAG: CDP-diacylglycerol--glycerol-3-phosphate 3-phosphatidyltransferase [Spirochaetaceae bacterium]|jgi:CDP-diacylglycerol--glycerol-3-phosphate 3-phosphatidyltransferase|nr:CDP-diacylglycerol--glycerol-3-phosphate 3-phosphatidyltransferase [Spirochaetaceae bacterium]